MLSNAPHILIAGGGIGWLCLAQALKRIGIGYTVFERDEAPFARAQGYRLSLTPDGLHGLRQSLPQRLYAEIEREITPQSPYIPFVDQELHERFRKPMVKPEGPLDRWVSIDRVALRRTLLQGLDDDIKYGKKLTAYDHDGQSVHCWFEDGSMATGDVLVGTEGTRSIVRGQLLDTSNFVDTGVMSILGQLPYDQETQRDLEEPPLGQIAVVIDRPPQGMFLASHVRASAVEPGNSYIFWALLAKREAFPETLEQMIAGDLQALAIEKTRTWHERLRRLIGRTEVPTVRVIPYQASVRPAALPVGPVAIMGDAVHNMPPTAGQGANMALKDAAVLGSEMSNCDRTAGGLADAIAQYHRQMLDYAFPAVEESMQNMHQMLRRYG